MRPCLCPRLRGLRQIYSDRNTRIVPGIIKLRTSVVGSDGKGDQIRRIGHGMKPGQIVCEFKVVLILCKARLQIRKQSTDGYLLGLINSEHRVAIEAPKKAENHPAKYNSSPYHARIMLGRRLAFGNGVARRTRRISACTYR